MRASMAENLLVMLLARLAAPEVEDGATWTSPRTMLGAGDILRGKDGSIETMVELPRLIGMCREVLAANRQSAFLVTQELKAFVDSIHAILAAHRLDRSALGDEERHVIAELLEQIAGAYRWSSYHQGFSGHVAELRTQHVLALLDLIQQYAHFSMNAQHLANAIYAPAARA